MGLEEKLFVGLAELCTLPRFGSYCYISFD